MVELAGQRRLLREPDAHSRVADQVAEKDLHRELAQQVCVAGAVNETRGSLAHQLLDDVAPGDLGADERIGRIRPRRQGGSVPGAEVVAGAEGSRAGGAAESPSGGARAHRRQSGHVSSDLPARHTGAPLAPAPGDQAGDSRLTLNLAFDSARR